MRHRGRMKERRAGDVDLSSHSGGGGGSRERGWLTPLGETNDSWEKFLPLPLVRKRRDATRRGGVAAAFQSLISSLISRGSILMSLFFARRVPPEKRPRQRPGRFTRSLLSFRRALRIPRFLRGTGLISCALSDALRSTRRQESRASRTPRDLPWIRILYRGYSARYALERICISLSFALFPSLAETLVSNVAALYSDTSLCAILLQDCKVTRCRYKLNLSPTTWELRHFFLAIDKY